MKSDSDEVLVRLVVLMIMKEMSFSLEKAPRSRFEQRMSSPLLLPSARSRNCFGVSSTMLTTYSFSCCSVGKNSFFSLIHLLKLEMVSFLACVRSASRHAARPEECDVGSRKMATISPASRRTQLPSPLIVSREPEEEEGEGGELSSVAWCDVGVDLGEEEEEEDDEEAEGIDCTVLKVTLYPV